MKHGDKIVVTSRMWRGERYEKVEGKPNSVPVTAWRRRTAKAKSEIGVFLGWRTVQRGTTIWGGGDEQNYFKIYGYDKVALVSMAPNENPVYIHPDDLMAAEGETFDELVKRMLAAATREGHLATIKVKFNYLASTDHTEHSPEAH